MGMMWCRSTSPTRGFHLDDFVSNEGQGEVIAYEGVAVDIMMPGF
jgi:hypothetical protein